jgi:hypothetical protein
VRLTNQTGGFLATPPMSTKLAAALGLGALALYCVYFDYKRTHDPNYKENVKQRACCVGVWCAAAINANTCCAGRLKKKKEAELQSTEAPTAVCTV